MHDASMAESGSDLHPETWDRLEAALGVNGTIEARLSEIRRYLQGRRSAPLGSALMKFAERSSELSNLIVDDLIGQLQDLLRARHADPGSTAENGSQPREAHPEPV